MGITPLHNAVRGGREDVVTLLLECNADVSTKNSDGFTPLEESMEFGNPELVNTLKQFLENPTPPKQIEKIICTPLLLISCFPPFPKIFIFFFLIFFLGKWKKEISWMKKRKKSDLEGAPTPLDRKSGPST